MADLKCNHLKDETVHVRGTAYEVDGQGVARGVSEEHAKTMCQGSWRRVSGVAAPKPTPEKPAAPPAPAPKPAAAPDPKPASPSSASGASAAPEKTAQEKTETPKTTEEPDRKPKKRGSSGRRTRRNDA